MSDSPIIITLSHQKGGVGKSTLAFNLAAYFQKQGDACAVVDSDLQGTITEIYNNFSQDGETIAGVKLIRRDAFKDYKELLKLNQFALIVIDTPPYLSAELDSIYPISDFVLVPTKPSVKDYLAISKTITLVRAAKVVNPNVETGVVINMAVQSSKFNSIIREELEKEGVRVLKTEVGQRVEFTRYELYAGSIFDTEDEKAQAEISALGKELFTILSNN